MFATQGQSKTSSLFVLSLTRVRLRTLDPPIPHPKWKLLNGIGVMEYCLIIKRSTKHSFHP